MTERVLSGRLSAGPSTLVYEEVLRPQFEAEVQRLLPWYVLAEKVLLTEYRRMGLLEQSDCAEIGSLLNEIRPGSLIADQSANLSDLAFALECHVADRLSRPVPRWHVDRSRNDLQACAQLLYTRAELIDTAEQLMVCVEAAHRTAGPELTSAMPGYTHLQAAQVMTPGFYLLALTTELLQAVQGMLSRYDLIDLAPLGAGAMTGQELDWDRARIAALLGFAKPEQHPLVAVASRSWLLLVAAEMATIGVVLSRFVTDLMTWGSGQYRFLELPDELAGISSSMPQKKNFPVLERIRGRLAHLPASYLDAAMVQRATPYANSVEASKEGNVLLGGMFDVLRSALRLLTVVLQQVRFDHARMRQACEQEYLGGFTLANELVLVAGLPWRTAQVVAGDYIVTASEQQLPPARVAPELLVAAGRRRGHVITDAAALLTRAFDLDQALLHKQSTGSVHPAATRRLLEEQELQLEQLRRQWRERRMVTVGAMAQVDRLLGITGQGANLDAAVAGR